MVRRTVRPPRKEPLTGPHEFTVLFSFNDDYLEFAGNRVVTEAAAYAKRIGASKVKVAGYRATTVLSAAIALSKRPDSPRSARRISRLCLRGLGVSGVSVEWKADAGLGDGSTDPAHRRVTILVTP